MDPVTPPAHARPRDHMWVLVVIAAACLLKVWPSWIGIGSEAGFPVIGGKHGMPTDWTLAVVIEAYWAYAVWAALVPAGRRSGRFAGWSAAGVFALSLAGQSTAQVMTATGVKVFANALPVTVLALIAVLVHMRHLDRDVAALAEEAARKAEQRAVAEAAAADERTVLRIQLDAANAALEPLRADLETAQRELARVTAKAEMLAAKLEALSAQRKRKRTAQQRPGKSAQEDDLTTEMRALTLMDKDPSLRGPRMGGELARRLGVSAPTGRRLHAKLTAQGRSGEPLTDRSADQSGERS